MSAEPETTTVEETAQLGAVVEETKKNAKSKGKNTKESSNDEEEEYEVEKIMGHRIYKSKVIKYEVKWKGYTDEDNTFEAANTLHDDVPDLCIAYWKTQTGVNLPTNIPTKDSEVVVEEPAKKKTEPKKSSTKKRVLEETTTTTTATAAATTTTKKSRKSSQGTEHVPKYMVKLGYTYPTAYPTKSTDWDQEVRKICVQASPKDAKIILTYIEWNNDEKTIHEMDEVHSKIPEKLIAYYEERLQFI